MSRASWRPSLLGGRWLGQLVDRRRFPASRDGIARLKRLAAAQVGKPTSMGRVWSRRRDSSPSLHHSSAVMPK